MDFEAGIPLTYQPMFHCCMRLSGLLLEPLHHFSRDIFIWQSLWPFDITINAHHYWRTLLKPLYCHQESITACLQDHWLLRDSACPLVTVTVQDILHSMHWKILVYPLYSLDLSLCVQLPQEGTKIAVDMGQTQVLVLWWWCSASSSCL